MYSGSLVMFLNIHKEFLMLSKASLTKVQSQLRTEIQQAMQDNDIPGMAISLVNHEGILWAEGFGYTDRSQQQPATADSLFNLQSSGKMINAATFFRVAQQGLVSMDTPLTEVYPDLQLNDRWGGQEYRKITFRHLLSHHAGLTHESPLGGNWDNRDLPFEEIIDSINGTWLVAPVGQEHRYSNCGMSLAMYGLQQITGIPVRELVRQEVIEPLELSSMTYGKPAAQQHPEYVTGYDEAYETLFESFSDLGAGCQYVSVRDFSRFIQMHLNNGQVNGQTYLEPSLLEEARTAQFTDVSKNTSAGLGLFIFTNIIPGQKVYGHAGGGCGYSGEILWSLEHQLGVMIETNNESGGFGPALSLARNALRSAVEAQGVQVPAAGAPQTTERPVKPLPVQTAQQLCGEYVYYDTRVAVAYQEGQLVYTLYDKEHPLTYHGDLVFSADYPPEIEFHLQDNGQPTHLIWLNSQGEYLKFYFDRIGDSDVQADPAELEQYVGLYQGRVYGFRPYGAVRRSGQHLEISFFRFAGKLEAYLPGLFFTPDGEYIRFEGRSAWFSNRPVEKVDDPLLDLKRLIDEDPGSYMLLEYNLKHSLAPMLKFLGRDLEAEQVLSLCEQLHGSREESPQAAH